MIPSIHKKNLLGFTLLEVMVAVAVLAIALTAVIKTAGQNASNAAILRDKTFAHWVAMNKIAELQIEKKYPRAGTQKGDYELGGNKWYWVVNVTETPNVNLRRVDVEVYLDKDSENSATVLTGYLIDPKAGG